MSGCDTVLYMKSIGKKTVWDLWRCVPNLRPVFARLSRTPSHITEEDLNDLERFTVLLYSRTSSLMHVNEARSSSSHKAIDKLKTYAEDLRQSVKIAVDGAPRHDMFIKRIGASIHDTSKSLS